MDSFYDAPRKPLIPTPIQRISDTPLVPEVSLITLPQPPVEHRATNDFWKSLKGSIDQRIITPGIDKQAQLQNRPNYAQRSDKIKAMCSSSIPSKFTESNNLQKQENNLPMFNNKATFEEVYMANVPNRLLDLSLIVTDPPQNEKPDSLFTIETPRTSETVLTNNVSHNAEHKDDKSRKDPAISLPKTYKQYRSSVQKRIDERLQVNDFITDILNYKRNDKKVGSLLEMEVNKKSIGTHEDEHANNNTGPHKHHKINVTCNSQADHFRIFKPDLQFKQCNCNNIVSNKTVTSTSVQTDIEPNYQDLFKIIQQQNDLIMILQKQNAKLTDQLSSKPNYPNCVTSTQHDRDPNTPFKGQGPRSKFSMTTSFAVSFHPQQNLFQRTNNWDLEPEPRIQELTESENIYSESLEAHNNFAEFDGRSSPEPSIRIDKSDQETNNVDNMSFYSDAMQQINNILNKADIQRNVEAPQQEAMTRKNGKKDTMKLVEEATLKHLRTVGVDISSTEIEQFSESGVKQLLINHLPHDCLPKAKQKEPLLRDHSKERGNLIQTRREFSIASVQYMKKYNLLASDDDDCQRNDVLQNRNCSLPKVKTVQRNSDPNKILDITALRQLPKLL